MAVAEELEGMNGFDREELKRDDKEALWNTASRREGVAATIRPKLIVVIGEAVGVHVLDSDQ